MPKNSRKQVYDDEYDARFYSHLVPQGQGASQSQNSYGGSKKHSKKKKSHRKRSKDREEKPPLQKSLVDYDDISSDSDIVSVSPQSTIESAPKSSSHTSRPGPTSRSDNYSHGRHGRASNKRNDSPGNIARTHGRYTSRSTSRDRNDAPRPQSRNRPAKSKKKRSRHKRHSPPAEDFHGAHDGHKDVKHSSAPRTSLPADSRDSQKSYADLPKAYLMDYKDSDDKRHRSPSPFYKYEKRERRSSPSPSSR